MTQTAPELNAIHNAGEQVIYEQPLNERMRTFLRLEFLFRQARHHGNGQSQWQTRAAIASLLEILQILNRGDVRSDALKELERHAAALEKYRASPGVDGTRLTQALTEVERVRAALIASDKQLTLWLKECEFLSAIKHRSAIPGGTCEFDLPDYRHWLSRAPQQRQADFERWIGTLDALDRAVQEVLWLTREAAQTQRQRTSEGMFQHTLDRNGSCQLLRVALPANSDLFPEISGSQHRFTIRFRTWRDVDKRPEVVNDDIEFYLTCC